MTRQWSVPLNADPLSTFFEYLAEDSPLHPATVRRFKGLSRERVNPPGVVLPRSTLFTGTDANSFRELVYGTR